MVQQYGAAEQIYVIANIAIALGYLCVPALVLPFIQLRRRTLVAGAAFFLGCTGSHIDMVYDVIAHRGEHPPVGWVAVVWHIIQAAGTWAFIMFFRAELTAARRTLEEAEEIARDTDHVIEEAPAAARVELAETVAALRATHGHHPTPANDPHMDAALGKLPAKGEFIKAAPAVFMVCGTLIVVAILTVYLALVLTGSPTDAFFRLINLFLNALGTIATMATLTVAIIHARRTLENRRIALRGQEEAHRAAEVATVTARAVNGEMDRRIKEAAERAAAEAAARLRIERQADTARPDGDTGGPGD